MDKIIIDFNIDFWNEETERDFYKYRDFLVENSNMDTFQARDFLTNIYYSVGREYGD